MLDRLWIGSHVRPLNQHAKHGYQLSFSPCLSMSFWINNAETLLTFCSPAALQQHPTIHAYSQTPPPPTHSHIQYIVRGLYLNGLSSYLFICVTHVQINMSTLQWNRGWLSGDCLVWGETPQPAPPSHTAPAVEL